MTPWTDARVSQLKALFEDGLSSAMIADKLCVTRNTVCGKIARLGLQRPGAPLVKKKKTYRRRVKNSWNLSGPLSDHESPKRLPPTPVNDQEIPEAQRKQLLDLESHHCRWPVGDPQSADLFFCAGDITPSFPYCPAHCARAYTYRPKNSNAAEIVARRQRSTRRAAEAAIRGRAA